MSYLIDTDVLIDGLRQRDSTIALYRQLAPARMAISIVSVGEVYDGTFSSMNPAQHLTDARRYLRGFSILGLTDATMEAFARERARLRRAGQLIPDMDLLIAATALTHDLELVTRNERHFRRVNGLRVFVPS